MNDADRRRAKTLADQARHSRNAKASLRLAIRHLEGAQKAARADGLLDQGAAVSRLIRESTDVLRNWPSHERAAS